jgi:hypothetical protein
MVSKVLAAPKMANAWMFMQHTQLYTFDTIDKLWIARVDISKLS